MIVGTNREETNRNRDHIAKRVLINCETSTPFNAKQNKQLLVNCSPVRAWLVQALAPV